MIKSDLILRVAAENPHLSDADVVRAVKAVLDRIKDALVAGDRVELRGLGVFTVAENSPRTAINPRTGKAVPVAAKRLPKFKLSRLMHARLNPSGTAISAEMDDEVEPLSRAS